MADYMKNGKYADLPGVRMWYVDTEGTGEAVLLLHSTTGTSVSWEPQIMALAGAGYRVIAPDRSGWGRSVANPATGSQHRKTGADDLDALVDHLKLGKFHLGGIGGGGLIALDYAAWRSDRLRSLIIGSCIASRSEKEILDFSARIAAPEGVKLPRVYTDVGASYRGSNPEGIARWLEIERHCRQPGAPGVELRTPNTYAKLASITVPTLVMAGASDLVAPPALMRLWAPHVKRSEWVVVPDAGHSMAWEQPDIFNEKVLEFMRRAG
jgi:pimeloyl-ACP methyl ester carboxylesterase